MNTSVPKYLDGPENAGDKFAELRRLALCLAMTQKRRNDGTAWYMTKNMGVLTQRYNQVLQLCAELNIQYTNLELADNIRPWFLEYMEKPPTADEKSAAAFTVVDRFGQNAEDRKVPQNQAARG